MTFRNSLYAKLSVGLFVLLLAIGALYAAISVTLTSHYLRQINQELNRDLARNLVADRNLVAEGRLDQEALKETFHKYMSINPSIEIYLLDLEGKILAYSADPKKIKRNSVSLGPIRRFLKMDEPYPLLGDDPRSHDREKAFSVTPVPSAEAPEGYLYVVLRGEEYDSAETVVRDSYLLRMSGWAMLASLGVGLFAGLVVFRLLTRRLERLSGRIQAFAEAGGDTPSDDIPAGADEVDRLSLTFEHMAARIQAQIEQLREKDAQRRQLVAQVSHDLRTPLAAMQGYLESLQMKRDSLAPERQAEFLDIALRQGRRLGRLIDALFELARLDAREDPPEPEPFPLGELIYDALEKHRLRAEEMGTAIEVSVAADLPFAVGDIGMTERVLDNLLDNALAHAPDGGRIAVGATATDDKVELSVTDDGPGIAAEDQARLFDPFFRAASGPGDGSHAGLGLAIAKRIMEAQGGDIRVISDAAEGGCTFTLRLPRHGI